MDVEKLTDCLNAPVQGTGADGLKLALALLWERRNECPEAVPVLVCHDEVVVQCELEQSADAKAWLEKAMIEGMKAVLHGMDEVNVPVGRTTLIIMLTRRVLWRAGRDCDRWLSSEPSSALGVHLLGRYDCGKR